MKYDMFVQSTAAVMLAAAALSAPSAVAVEPATVEFGPLYIAPTLGENVAYVDNLFRSALSEKGSWVNEFNPQVQAWLQDGVNTYSTSYEITDYRYVSSRADNYTDHRVNVDINHEFNVRNKLYAYGEYYDGHEERGTGLTDGFGQLVDSPIEYQRSTVGGDYNYGTRASRGRLELAAEAASYDYQNFREFTRYRDRDQDSLSATFLWKIGARTDALAQVRAINNEFDTVNPGNDAGTRDSDELNYLLGLSWEASAKTSGSVKLGMYDRSYDSRKRADDSGFQWEVDLTYEPRSYSRFNFETRRYTQETNGVGDAVNTREMRLDWDHDWGNRMTTSVFVLLADEDYTGSVREDERFDVEASYSFSARRWLDLGMGLRREDRSSDVAIYEYTRNVFFLEAKLSL